MSRCLRGFFVWVAGAALVHGAGAAESSPAAPFKEVYELIRTNAAVLTDAELNRAAVEGLLAQLSSAAWIADTASEPSPETNAATVSSSAVFDDAYGYVRAARVSENLPEEFGRALEELQSTNKLRGLVIDLRFAAGNDYAAAGAVADRFVGSEQELLEWRGGSVKSREKTDALRWPVAVLVNRFTIGAAEALAGVLRHTDVALLIGTNTAGQASTTKDFQLSNGQMLRIATAPVKFGNGNPISTLVPDIIVEVSPEDERIYFTDAYKVLPRSGMGGAATNLASLTATNRAPRRRINEAELVRMLREGQDIENELSRPARPAAPARPVINDPALARAIDLLKALAVVRHTRF